MIRNRIYDLFFLGFLFVVLCGVSLLLAPFAGALLAALVCAIMFYPLYEALHRWFPRQRPSSIALIADILVLIVFVAPMILLTWAIIQESSYLGPAIKQWNVTLDQWRLGKVTDSVPGMGHLQRVLGTVVGMTHLQFQENVIEGVSKTLEAIAGWGSFVADHAVVFILNLGGIFFILFFLFREGDKWFGYIHDLVPMNRSDKEDLMERIRDTVIGVSRGWLLTSLIQGVMAMLVYLAVGIEGAVLLGALTAFFGLVPGVGTVGIWVPVAIFLLAKGLYWRSAFVLVWGALIVVGVIDTVARPYLIGKRVELPLFVLFFALLGGVSVWGAKGIIIGPILVAITPVLLDIYRDRYLRTAETNPKRSAAGMKIMGFILIGINMVMVSPLRAGETDVSQARASAHFKKHEKQLERMEANRSLDNEHTRQAQEEFRKGTAEMSGNAEQQVRNVQDLKTVESQITTGNKQKTLAHQSYKDTVHTYGSDDPRSTAARQNWKNSQQAMDPLLLSRQSLKDDVHQGSLLAHNEKAVLSIQKLKMNSYARYRAMDDLTITKQEKNIADDQRAMTTNVASSQGPSLP